MKRFFAAAVLLIFSAGNVPATQTRLNGLGVSNWMIKDDFNIWLNPARIVQYNKTAWFELGVAPAPQPSTQWAGISYNLFKGVGALFISRPYTSNLNTLGTNPAGSDVIAVPNNVMPNVTNSPNGMGNLTTLAPQNKFDIFYGFKLRENVLFGAMLNLNSDYSQSENRFESFSLTDNDGLASSERKSMETNLVLGLTFLNGASNYESDVILNLGFPYVSNNYSDRYYVSSESSYAFDERSLQSASPLSYGITARKIKTINETSSILGYLKANFTNLNNNYTDIKDVNADGTIEINTKQERKQAISDYSLGLALNSQCGQKCLLIIGSEFNLTRTANNALSRNLINDSITNEYNYSQTAYVVPLMAGLEYTISKVFTARTGLQKNVFQWTTTEVDNPDYNIIPNTLENKITSKSTTHAQPAVTVSMGLSVNAWGGLVIDTVVDCDILYSGGYLVSGIANRPFTQITALYKF